MPSGSGGKYVPPHLRGGDNNHNSSSGTSSISSTNTTSGSRWKNLDDNGNNGRGNQTNRTARHDSRNGDHANSNNSSSSRRWANVDRSKIDTGSYSNARNGYHSHGLNNNDVMFKRHFNGPTTNSHHDRRRGFSNDNRKLADAKAVFFGDSFIKLFGLLNEYSESVKTPYPIEVQKYKAASAKGLCREGNENRTKILRMIDNIRRSHEQRNSRNNPSKAYQHIERLVFCFGSVDVHMSYYFKKYVQQQPLSDEDLQAIATNYVDFVADLNTGTKLTKLIVGIYPSPLCDKDVGSSLMAYGSLESKNQVGAVDASEDKSIELRQARVDLFNHALQERCAFHNQTSGNGILEYWDIRDELLTQDEFGRPRVRDAYKDVSDLNIHLIHETVLQLWVQKWPWYEALTTTRTPSDTNTSFLEYLQKSFDEYRKTKPWAERTHVAETQGVQLAP